MLQQVYYCATAVILATCFLGCDAGIIGNIYKTVKGAVGLDTTSAPEVETEMPPEKSLQTKVEEILTEMENVLSQAKQKQQENVKNFTERLNNLEINAITIRENFDDQFLKFENQMGKLFETTQKKMELPLHPDPKGFDSSDQLISEDTEFLPEKSIEIKLQESLKEMEKVLFQAEEKQKENEKILQERLDSLEINTVTIQENFENQFSKFENKMNKLFESTEKKMELLYPQLKGVNQGRNQKNEIPPQTIIAITGNSIDLQCNIATCVKHLSDYEDDFDIVWRINDYTLNFEKEWKFSLTSTMGLKIRNLTREDSANYSCEIRAHDFIEKQSYHLLVLDRAYICSGSPDEEQTEIGKTLSYFKDKQQNVEKFLTKITKF